MKPYLKAGLTLTLGTTLILAGYRAGQVAVMAQERGEAALPSDVRSDTLSRMPRAKREDFTDAADVAAFDRVLQFQPKQRTNVWLGPTGTRLHLPRIAVVYNEQDRLLMKEQNVMDPKYVELAIAVATREAGNKEEWINHEPLAVKVVGREVVEVVRLESKTDKIGEQEAALIQFGRESYHAPKVSSATFARMERDFGRKATLDIALIFGYYAANGILMRVYDQHMDTRPQCTALHSGCLDVAHPVPAW